MSEEKKTQAVERIDRLKVALNEDFVQNQLRSTLAENSGAFAASIIELYTGDTYLQQCDPRLVVMHAMKAAALKLPINKSLGFAWIIAYKGVPQFQMGYKGLVQLAMRTGFYKHLNADIVYEGEYKTANKLTGEFDISGERKSDNVIGFFAHFELLNGFSKTLYMTKDQVVKHAKKYSKSYANASSPWNTEFDKMAKKTVLSNLLSHWGYLSVEMANAMENDSNEDAADKVKNEINNNGNIETMDFVETGSDDSGAAATLFTNGPGF